jgi:hypothetical protein
VKDDDLVVGTHGRGIWILDDITPLRQIAGPLGERGSANAPAARDVILFKPQVAYRARWNLNTDTPMPPDEPTAPNPPEGAIINYYLRAAASGPVTLEITGADGKLVRRYSSADDVFTPDPATMTVPPYWFRPLRALPATAGMHRVTWDMHYQPIDAVAPDAKGRLGGPNLPIAAIAYNTVPAPATPWVNPGTFTMTLAVNGQTYSQPIVVKADPRVKTPALALQQVYTLSKASYYGTVDAQNAAREARRLRERIAAVRVQATGAVADSLAALDRTLEAIAPPPPAASGGRGRGSAPGASPDSLTGAGAALAGVMNLLQGADVQPTTVQVNAIAAARATAAKVMARWATIKSVDLAALNTQLKGAGLPALAP